MSVTVQHYHGRYQEKVEYMRKLLQTNKTIIYTGHEFVHFPCIAMTVAQSKVEKCEELQVHNFNYLHTLKQQNGIYLMYLLGRC